MDQIKDIAFSVCVALICGSIMNMLSPDGSLKKIYKLVICVFLLSTIISPLSEIDFSDSFNFEDKSSKAFEIDEEMFFLGTTEEIVEEQIKNDTEEMFEEMGIIFKDISVKINILESGNIDINKFTVTIDQNYDFSEIKEKVKNKIGMEPEIIVSGEEENGNIE